MLLFSLLGLGAWFVIFSNQCHDECCNVDCGVGECILDGTESAGYICECDTGYANSNGDNSLDCI